MYSPFPIRPEILLPLIVCNANCAAVARRFAILKCRVSIAGRNEARAKRILWEANLGNPGPMGKFYKVNLESMHDIERFTDEVKQDFKDKGIDYLILSAGGPPSGIWRPGLGVPPFRDPFCLSLFSSGSMDEC